MPLVGDQLDRFMRYLELCERRSYRLTNWENEFVVGLRESFNERETQLDMGLTPWSPTTNQWNTLHGIWSKL